MKRIVINDNERGILFKDGRYEKFLDVGKHYIFGSRSYHTMNTTDKLPNDWYQYLRNDDKAASQLAVVNVKDNELALHYVNGNFEGALTAGTHAFWNVYDKHEFRTVGITDCEVGEDIPKYIFSRMSRSCFSQFTVADFEQGRLYINERMVKVLQSGTYYFWNNGTDVRVETIDMRQCSMEVKGQSVLTKDKVEVRITFVLSYRITDCVKAATEIDDFRTQLYTAAQLTLRELAGRYKMDELLENRDELSKLTAELLREKAARLYAEIGEAGIRDIILPGEISEIMNTVLAAEKRAQANVIMRREEVASTRSLLNTAKLMDENKTLYKLKELEYIERICENVGNISVESGKGLLSQLATIVGNDK